MTSPVPGYSVTTAFGVPGSWEAGEHTGEDYACPTGTPVVASAPGQVIKAGPQDDYGNRVDIACHLDGCQHSYSHLSKIRVNVGQAVAPGQQVGDSGSTGRSTGPHLHYEERRAPWGYYDYRQPQHPRNPAPAAPAPAEPAWLIEGVISMAAYTIVFFQRGGTLFEADLIAGTYRAIANTADRDDRKHVLTKMGVPWTDWAPGKDVANPDAFGVRVA